MQDLFHLTSPWWTYVVRGALTYTGLMVMMRLSGKRSFGELSAFDIIVIALAGGALRTAIIGDDTGVLAPFIGVASILMTDRIVATLSARWPRFNRLVEGYPTVLIQHGQRDRAAMRQQNVPDAALDRALHAHGLEDDDDILIGRLEPNGKITMVRRAHGKQAR